MTDHDKLRKAISLARDDVKRIRATATSMSPARDHADIMELLCDAAEKTIPRKVEVSATVFAAEDGSLRILSYNYRPGHNLQSAAQFTMTGSLRGGVVMDDLPNTVGDQSAFWQRQRELTQGPIEDPAIKRRHWNWWLIGMPLVLVGMIAVARWV